MATIENDLVSVSYQLSRGTYTVTDRKRGRVVVADAITKLNDMASSADGAVRTVASEPLSDALGTGRSLLVTTAAPGGPKLLLRISLYDGAGLRRAFRRHRQRHRRRDPAQGDHAPLRDWRSRARTCGQTTPRSTGPAAAARRSSTTSPASGPAATTCWPRSAAVRRSGRWSWAASPTPSSRSTPRPSRRPAGSRVRL